MLEALKTGDWLTPARLRIYPALMLGLCIAAIVLLLGTAHGNLDRAGRPLGADFSEVWVAGQSVREGDAAAAYDLRHHQTRQDEYFGASQDFYLFSYPPFFLAIAAALAFLPYLGALALWQSATLGLYLWACVAAFEEKTTQTLPRRTIFFAALSFPAVFVTLVHGQNGFLTAALLTGGLLALDKKKPVLAGVLFACLAFKPQYALLLPFALLAAKDVRAIVAGAVTLCVLTLATLGLFGTTVWLGFFDGLTLARHLVLDEGGAGYEKMQSLFAASRMLGAPLPFAYAVQTIGTLSVAAAIVWLWSSKADYRLKGAALLCGSLLATPYGFDYDLVILGPALAMLASHGLAQGFQPFQKSLLFALWLLPLIARPLMMVTSLPLSCLMLVVLFAAILRWAKVPCAAANLGHWELNKC